jgi:hypothetical protein
MIVLTRLMIPFVQDVLFSFRPAIPGTSLISGQAWKIADRSASEMFADNA